MSATASCDRHRELVALALRDDADDATLERYAAEVPGCAECRRALASELVVHPAVLASDEANPGMAALSAALAVAPERPGVARALAAPASPRAQRLAIGTLAVAMAAGTLWVASAWLEGGEPVAPPVAHPAPVAALGHRERPLAPPPRIEAPSPAPAPVVATSPAPVAPRRPSPPRAAAAPTLPADDGVAEADWPPPPYEDLASGGAKGVSSAVRAVQLVVTGGHRVGQAAGLVAVASAETELAVCVEGPERGVVWKGSVPAGRTDLRRGRDLVSFAFAAPGTYRFSVSTSDLAACRAPVHVVEVEVSP